MKLFVTGGAGFIGSNFIRHVLATRPEWHIVNYDKLTYAGNLANLREIASDPRYGFVRGDIRDAAMVAASMRGCDAVVHFAAESHVDRSIYDPAPVIDTNVTGTFVLLKAASELNLRFLHVSTDEVYGEMKPGQVADERSPIEPNSPYAASKAASDMLVRSFARTYGLPAVITRSSNNYGPYQFLEKFLPLMICNAMQDAALPIYGDGLQQRDWLHVEDHCRGLLAALEGGRVGEVYNIGGGNVLPNVEIVRRVLRILGKPESLMQSVADRPGHDRRYALNCTKIANELGWRPEISLEDGLARAVEWYRSNAKWIGEVRGGEYRNYYEKFYTNRDATMSARRHKVSPY